MQGLCIFQCMSSNVFVRCQLVSPQTNEEYRNYIIDKGNLHVNKPATIWGVGNLPNQSQGCMPQKGVQNRQQCSFLLFAQCPSFYSSHILKFCPNSIPSN